MAEITGISWCDATVNFWHGCEKVTEGCKNCYMFRDKARWKQDGGIVIRSKTSTIVTTLTKLLAQKNERATQGINEPLKIFTCSWSDFFIEQADPWRADAWKIIRMHPEFVWIILTKRPERIMQCLPEDWGDGWPNVWLCVSAENQARAEERIPLLLDVPAKVRGVSVEPILGPVNLKHLDADRFDYPGYYTSTNALNGNRWDMGRDCKPTNKLDWVIIGGESGNETGKYKYRPAEIEWFEKIIYDCVKHHVPVFMKQLGTTLAKKYKLKDRAGATLNEFPASLHELLIQQFPI